MLRTSQEFSATTAATIATDGNAWFTLDAQTPQSAVHFKSVPMLFSVVVHKFLLLLLPLSLLFKQLLWLAVVVSGSAVAVAVAAAVFINSDSCHQSSLVVFTGAAGAQTTAAVGLRVRQAVGHGRV